MRNIARKVTEIINSDYREGILSRLPYKNDDSKPSLTKKELADNMRVRLDIISSQLRYLKDHYKIRKYRGGKYRRTDERFA